jgi:hypothetical protein
VYDPAHVGKSAADRQFGRAVISAGTGDISPPSPNLTSLSPVWPWRLLPDASMLVAKKWFYD